MSELALYILPRRISALEKNYGEAAVNAAAASFRLWSRLISPNARLDEGQAQHLATEIVDRYHKKGGG